MAEAMPYRSCISREALDGSRNALQLLWQIRECVVFCGSEKAGLNVKRRSGTSPLSAGFVQACGWWSELVAEASGDGDLVAALGATAAENGSAGFGGHANEESVNLATAAAIGLEGALGHRVILSLMIFAGLQQKQRAREDGMVCCMERERGVASQATPRRLCKPCLAARPSISELRKTSKNMCDTIRK